ncbi:MAG: 6,7-dimethyl-8-ribityllumazine synthase [Alphaproteobacteria bacterium]|nr:6,7-dimethyl-8-ribityllumazine synthase [Alphaproteobacteria bacterium]
MLTEKKPPRSFNFEQKPHVLIVEARFYDDIANMLLQGVTTVLETNGATYEKITVPGSLEIPAAIVYALKSLDFDAMRRRFDGYVALGCVLKGGTMHDQIVGTESARGLQELAMRYALAIGNGILTCNTREQAVERADPAGMNRGAEAAEACLAMIELKGHFRLTNAKRRWVPGRA